MNMNKIITLFLISFSIATAVGQEQSKISKTSKKNNVSVSDIINPRLKEKNYNKWSLNLNGGTNLPVGPFSKGYQSASSDYFKNPNFNHVDFNVRKMFNTKFGMTWNVAYDNFTNKGNSLPFNNNMFSTSFQGVLNVHRALNWEEFTDTFGLQLHFGPGLTFLRGKYKDTPNDQSITFDNIYSIISGATVLVKVSEHLALNFDYSLMKNFSHHANIDGTSRVEQNANRTATIHTTSFGLTLYLGKKEKHADWYWENKKVVDEDLLARINSLETKMNDGNKDGFPDQFEAYVDAKIVASPQTINNQVISDGNNYTNEVALNMINSQYVNVFFDFDKSNISTGTISAINFLIKYLNANPESNVEVIGYADEIGNPEYNLRLSEKRAKNVAEMMVRSGIDSSRLKIVVKGEDNSVPKESKLARQLVRRVAFKVN